MFNRGGPCRPEDPTEFRGGLSCRATRRNVGVVEARKREVNDLTPEERTSREYSRRRDSGRKTGARSGKRRRSRCHVPLLVSLVKGSTPMLR